MSSQQSNQPHHIQTAERFLLQHYGITIQTPPRMKSIMHPYCMSEWIEEPTPTVLKEHRNRLDRPDSQVIGTLFAKRYSVFLMGAMCSLSLFDSLLDTSAYHVYHALHKQAAMTYASRWEQPTMLSSLNNEIDRTQVVQSYISRLQTNTQSLFDAVATHTGANTKVMWSLVAHNMTTLYSRLELEIEYTERLWHIHLDKNLLFTPSPENKLAISFRRMHSTSSLSELYVRRHCCLAYKLTHQEQAHGYCLTCPKLDSNKK